MVDEKEAGIKLKSVDWGAETSISHAAVLSSYFVENHIGNSFVVPTEMVRSL